MLVFLRDLLQAFQERAAYKSFAEEKRPLLQEWLNRQWIHFTLLQPGPWMLCEGCAVAGLHIELDHKNVLLRWNTYFRPDARHGLPSLETAALGLYGNYDLHIVLTGPQAPAILACHDSGKRPATWKLNASPFGPPFQEHADALREALRRAHLANALCGTPWAAPDACGALSVPGRSDMAAPELLALAEPIDPGKTGRPGLPG